MTTSPIFKLTHGSAYIDLDSTDKYEVIRDAFVPPITQTDPIIAGGTVQNRYRGSVKVSEQAADILWSFAVLCLGSTDSECRMRARKLQSFITQYAGDRVTPLQFHYRENSDVATEPLWGEYGANKRYEITHANVQISDTYSDGDRRASGIELICNCLIRPFANGLKMRLGSATGGILEDTLGTVDGRSRGLIIPEATTNKMTNPVFGHSTWNNGWVAASLTDTENTDDEFLYPGATSSAKLTATTQDIYYNTINVGNTNTHTFSAYVKKDDGSAVSSSDCFIYYGGSKTAAYTNMGNGIYLVSWSGAGIAAATATGLTVTANHSLYLLGYQAEEKPYNTPLAWGDLLGHAWTGTAHASTSTRTVAKYIHSTDIINTGQWSVRIVWKPALGATGFSSSVLLFDTDSGGQIRLYFQAADDKFYLEDNTNTISTAAQTFSANDLLVIHAVAKSGSLKIYIDGTEAATGSTYTPPTLGTYFYLGTSATPSQHANGTFFDFATYSIAPTAAEVLADYTNIAAIIADGERVGCIPWLWTKDGDDTVDNCDGEVSSADKDNWAMCGGIPGSIAAKTRLVLDPANATYENAIWLGLNVKDYGDYVPQASQYYIEASGTADTGNASGDAYSSKTLPAAPYPSILLSTITKPETLTGRINWFVRFKASSGTPSISMYPIIVINGVNIYNSTAVTKAASTSYELYYLGKTDIDLTEFDAEGLTISYQIAFNGSATIHVDFAQIIDGPLMKIQPTFFDTPDGAASASYFDEVTLEGRRANVDSSNYQPVLTGDIIELVPDKLNRLYILMGDDSGTHVITNTLTFNSIDVTPRYALL